MPNQPGVHMSGMLSLWIIYLLRKKPMTGYQILHEISQITGETWHPTTGAVYPALHKLRKKGLIFAEKAGARGKITYALTGKGRETHEAMRKKVTATMSNSKFRRVFESLAWPNEPDGFREEIEAIYLALMAMRDRMKRNDYKEAAAKLSKIRKQIERINQNS